MPMTEPATELPGRTGHDRGGPGTEQWDDRGRLRWSQPSELFPDPPGTTHAVASVVTVTKSYRRRGLSGVDEPDVPDPDPVGLQPMEDLQRDVTAGAVSEQMQPLRGTAGVDQTAPDRSRPRTHVTVRERILDDRLDAPSGPVEPIDERMQTRIASTIVRADDVEDRQHPCGHPVTLAHLPPAGG